MRQLIAALVTLSLVIPVVDATAAKRTPEEKAAAKAAKAVAKAEKAVAKAEKAQQKAQKRVASIEGKITKEDTKHAKRVLKLEAVESKLRDRGNVEAADNLLEAIEKETRRHDRVMARLQQALDDAQAEPDPDSDPEPDP